MQSATLILPGRGTKGGSEAMAASDLSVLVPGDQVDERVLVQDWMKWLTSCRTR